MFGVWIVVLVINGVDMVKMMNKIDMMNIFVLVMFLMCFSVVSFNEVI